MRLSRKPSDALGLRKMSSVRSGVGSPNAEGAGSPFQPASQRKADGPSGASPVRLSARWMLVPLALQALQAACQHQPSPSGFTDAAPMLPVAH